MPHDETFLILGGGGMVGLQIARRIASDLTPRKIVLVSLYRQEIDDALDDLQHMFGSSNIEFVGYAGDIFTRQEFSDQLRSKVLESYTNRDKLYEDLFGRFDAAYAQSLLVMLIQEHRPDVIIDGINTATAISYQDVFTATVTTKQKIDELFEKVAASEMEQARGMWKAAEAEFENLILFQSIPQLIRHVLFINQAMREVGTRLYLKIGTTGTGGMGLNIPYTHGEDKPSPVLMTKTAVAFAHTGLLFLMARTPGGPIVKELKPGAMIGYADITCRTVYTRQGNPFVLYAASQEPLSGSLRLKQDPSQYERLGLLDLPVIDTGENGLFTKGEFEAITALRQMEFITPEEIALDAVLEIKGSNTGRDVISAIDGSVMNPTYRAGYLRQQALEELKRLELETGAHSVALGILGPPELSKLLWEAELLRIQYGTLAEVLEQDPGDISADLYHYLRENPAVLHSITSIGVPVLTPDGQNLLRGPALNIPEVKGAHEVPIVAGDIEKWADKGWVDLRAANFARWQARFQLMERKRQRVRGKGSAAVTREAYLFDDIRIGTIVGWIFNNEEEGYRIKAA
ncbi:MAG: hypothetical protein A2Z16_03665 [Chloroflexi bacterium RBG_16_54_18]|nr:MAG: hypothetical protein A2Z16_03665 [Chloroflexi bacterium RBG_16_54_18]